MSPAYSSPLSARPILPSLARPRRSLSRGPAGLSSTAAGPISCPRLSRGGPLSDPATSLQRVAGSLELISASRSGLTPSRGGVRAASPATHSRLSFAATSLASTRREIDPTRSIRSPSVVPHRITGASAWASLTTDKSTPGVST